MIFISKLNKKQYLNQLRKLSCVFTSSIKLTLKLLKNADHNLPLYNSFKKQVKKYLFLIALSLIISLVINLISPFISKKDSPFSANIVLGQNDIFEKSNDDFLYQTKKSRYYVAKFGDRADEYRHRLQIKQTNQIFESSFVIPPSTKQTTKYNIDDSLTTQSLLPESLYIPPEATESASSAAELNLQKNTPSISPSDLQTPPASASSVVNNLNNKPSLSTPSAKFFQNLKTQLVEIQHDIASISSQLDKISQESAKIAWQIKKITGKTEIGFLKNQPIIKNESIIPGLDIKYLANTDSLREIITIKNKQSLESLLQNNQLQLKFKLKLTNLIPNRDEHGNWIFRSAENNSNVFTIPTPFITDASGATASARIELKNVHDSSLESTEFIFSIITSSVWLLDDSRVYPITIKHPIKVNRQNIEFDPRKTLYRSLPINTNITILPDQNNYLYISSLPKRLGGIKYMFAPTSGKVKILHGEGSYLEFALANQLDKVKNLNLVGNQILWQAKPGLTARFTSLTDRIKADYIISSRTLLSGANKNQLDFVLNYSDKPGPQGARPAYPLVPKLNKDGTISFNSDDPVFGPEVFKLPVPKISDAIGQQTNGNFTLVQLFSGSISLTISIPENFLDQAIFPLTIDPTVLSSSGEVHQTYGAQRAVIRTVNGKLVACYVLDASENLACRASNDNGATWGSQTSIAIRAWGYSLAADHTAPDTFHLVSLDQTAADSFRGDIKYYKGTLSGTTISFSSGVTLDSSTWARVTDIIVDTENNRPAVVWTVINTTLGSRRSVVRFMRCKNGATDCDTAITNWCNAAGTSCGTAASSSASSGAGSSDEMGEETSRFRYALYNATLEQMPGTGTRSNDLYVWWINSTVDEIYYNYADWDDVNSWTWQTPAIEDSTVSSHNNVLYTLASVRDETNNVLIFGYQDENGAIDNYQVYERNTSNIRTSRGVPDTEDGGNFSIAFAENSGDIYAIYRSINTNPNFELRINSGGTTWTAAQILDKGTDNNLIMPKTDATGAQLDFIWKAGSAAPFSIEYHTWHTNETRAVSSQTSLPTDDSITLTDIDDFFFDEQDYENTNTSDDTYDSGATADSASDYLVYYFKDSNNNNSRALNPQWEGQFNQACSSTYPAKLQVYNRTSSSWEDVASSTTCSANTDFTLSGSITTNLTNYYGSDTYIGSNVVAFRVYKQSNGTAAVSGKTDLFSQTYELFTHPATVLTQRSDDYANSLWNGRNIIKTANGKLVACYTIDSGPHNIECRASSDNGASWGTAATISGYKPATAIYQDQSDGNTFHLVAIDALSDSVVYGDLFYYKGTLSGTNISFSSGLKLDDSGVAIYPAIITDSVNNRPAIIWSFQGTSRSGVRFFRCDAGATNCDTAATNWCNATGTSCGTIPTTESADGSTDVLVTDPASTTFVAALAEMPGNGTRSKDIYAWWTRSDDLDLEYNYADWNNATDWTWQTVADEDLTISDDLNMYTVLSVAPDTTNNKIYFNYADDNGTSTNLVVYERDTNNTKTSRGTIASFNDGDYSASTLSVYNGTIAAIYGSTKTDKGYLKINSSGTTWSSALTLNHGKLGRGDIIIEATSRIANTLRFGHRDTNDAFSIQFDSWHTNETRAVSSQTSLPTDDSISLTGIDDFFFDEEDYDNTATSDNTYDKEGHVDGVNDYLVYYFKDTNDNDTDTITPLWEGQFSQNCSSTNPAKLQIYNRCNSSWEDLDISTTCTANTDFTLFGTIRDKLSCYYGSDTYIGSNTVAVRVYKKSNGGSKLKGKTDLFSQNDHLFTSLEDKMRHGNWFDNIEKWFTF